MSERTAFEQLADLDPHIKLEFCETLFVIMRGTVSHSLAVAAARMVMELHEVAHDRELEAQGMSR